MLQISWELAPTDPVRFLCPVGIAAGHFGAGRYNEADSGHCCILESAPADFGLRGMPCHGAADRADIGSSGIGLQGEPAVEHDDDPVR